MSHQISVLIIEDEAIIRHNIRVFLEDEGFAVTAAETAEAGLELLSRQAPDICIVDLRLPGMNGEQFIMEGRIMAPDTRFLIHTGSLFIVSEELETAGFSQADVIQKPVHDLQLLSDLIRTKVQA